MMWLCTQRSLCHVWLLFNLSGWDRHCSKQLESRGETPPLHLSSCSAPLCSSCLWSALLFPFCLYFLRLFFLLCFSVHLELCSCYTVTAGVCVCVCVNEGLWTPVWMLEPQIELLLIFWSGSFSLVSPYSLLSPFLFTTQWFPLKAERVVLPVCLWLHVWIDWLGLGLQLKVTLLVVIQFALTVLSFKNKLNILNKIIKLIKKET